MVATRRRSRAAQQGPRKTCSRRFKTVRSVSADGRTREYSLAEPKVDGMEKVEVTRRNMKIRGKVTVAWLGQPTLDRDMTGVWLWRHRHHRSANLELASASPRSPATAFSSRITMQEIVFTVSSSLLLCLRQCTPCVKVNAACPSKRSPSVKKVFHIVELVTTVKRQGC